MKFKVGDKVRITDKSKVCNCKDCKEVMQNKYNDIYTIKGINNSKVIDLTVMNRSGNYVFVEAVGLELAAIPGQQLEFNFMRDK